MIVSADWRIEDLADFRRAGEGQLAHAIVGGQGPAYARRVERRDDVEDAGGTPASSASLATASAQSGVSSDGFTTIVQPAASAQPTLRVIIAIGKFQGVIAAQTPIGCLMVT